MIQEVIDIMGETKIDPERLDGCVIKLLGIFAQFGREEYADDTERQDALRAPLIEIIRSIAYTLTIQLNALLEAAEEVVKEGCNAKRCAFPPSVEIPNCKKCPMAKLKSAVEKAKRML